VLTIAELPFENSQKALHENMHAWIYAHMHVIMRRYADRRHLSGKEVRLSSYLSLLLSTDCNLNKDMLGVQVCIN